jgi:hypothetical protein
LRYPETASRICAFVRFGGAKTNRGFREFTPDDMAQARQNARLKPFTVFKMSDAETGMINHSNTPVSKEEYAVKHSFTG